MAENTKLSFEEALARLQECSEKLRGGTLSLEESAAVYEQSVGYYQTCTELLAQIRQKIEIYRPETGETEDL